MQKIKIILILSQYYIIKLILINFKKILNYSWKNVDISQIYIDRLIGYIILKYFSENKAWKEFQKVIVDYRKAFEPNLEVLQLGSTNRLLIVNLVWLCLPVAKIKRQMPKYRVRVTRKAFLKKIQFSTDTKLSYFIILQNRLYTEHFSVKCTFYHMVLQDHLKN